MKSLILQLIQSYALQYGVDPHVAISVATIESNLNPNAISETGDVGVFQLNPKSFPKYTQKQLLDPSTNIMLGIRYLASLHKTCTHRKGLTWLVCWNYGPGNASRVKHPELFPYVKKVIKVYNRITAGKVTALYHAKYLVVYGTGFSQLQ